MSKFKDTLLLLFWGLIAGAFFVGCILGFMYVFNHIGELFSFASIQHPVGRSVLACLALAMLAGVILGAVKLIAWVWTKTHKGYWETADKIFPQEVRFKLRSHPLAKAVLDGNDWKIMQQMGKKQAHWAQVSNQVIAHGMTALHIAVAVENKSACETLLYYKSDPLHPDKNSRTPLDYAVQTNNQPLIKLLEKYIKK